MMRVLVTLGMIIGCGAFAKTIKTNEVTLHDAPDWLTQPRVERVTDHIQMHMEWTIRRVEVYWHHTRADYARAQNLGPMSVAVTKYVDGKAEVHLGPEVDKDSFDQVFGHELVHVIAFQKYKGAIPKWLEEGLANHLSTKKPVDYKWLVSQPLPKDVHELAHPFSGSASLISYRYKASQAFAEMLAHKCGDLDELLRLSVERKMEDYMHRSCEIQDLNVAFHDWVKKKAKE